VSDLPALKFSRTL